MKRILLFSSFIFLNFISKAQHLDKQKAMSLVAKNATAIGLSDTDLYNSIVSDAYPNTTSGLTLIYLQQSFKSLPVFNQLQTLAFKNDLLVSNFGHRIDDIENKLNTKNIFPSITPTEAVKTAIKAKKIFFNSNLFASTITPGKKFDFGKAGIANENITAELMWVPVEDGKAVILSWQIYLVPANTSDYWMIRVDANSNQIISENNLTLYCNWDNNKSINFKDNFVLSSKKNKLSLKNDILQLFTPLKTPQHPNIINDASYRVVPFPYESPTHCPTATSLVSNPWSAAPGNATSLNWHSNGTTDYITTRGNNVWAQEDVDGNNGIGIAASSTNPSNPLSFDFQPDFSITPTETALNQNQNFNITNLFYWNNIMHDVVYQYGFDEPAGNYQSNNQGRGGSGNDYVLADAQDGSGTNNANFSAPGDGTSGRMQMYLWNAVPTFTVNTPSSIAGQYQAVESNFSTANKLATVGPKTGQVVYYNDDAAGTTHEGCAGVPVNAVLGKIALIDRGNCNFTIKVKNAQLAGAIAVVMVNNVAGSPIIMGGTDNTVTIPAVMISITDGAILKNQLSNNLNVTMSAGQAIDGDVDNGVICHEYGHGISIRLTGGPANSSCLSNAEQMGEGWSDYYSLMVTQDWANSLLTDGMLKPRGIGTYVIGQLPNQVGIRSQKYCTDFDINNKVYASTVPAEIHDLGEIWCATLWDMTWNIIEEAGTINPNIYNAAAPGGNSIALKLVTEAMKLQPCSPGFIDGRDAILKADSILYNSAYHCAIREAFRRRGMGIYASQGSSASVTDQVADYTPFVTITKSESIAEAVEGQTVTYTTEVNSCSPLTNYILRDTLPSNITYVSGGTYDAVNRVVSFPVNFLTGQVQSFSFVATINAGSYFTPQTLLNEQAATTSLPATLTASSTTSNVWSVTATQSQSSPNSFYTPNAAVTSDQKLESANIALGAGTSSLSFYHKYVTQAGIDGGAVEISTDNGTTWNDLSNKITSGYYNATLATGTNPLAGKKAWSGNSGSFIKSSINLSSYANLSVKLRFRFGSNNSVASTGWYVDDILLKKEPVVNIRSSLFDGTGVRVNYCDTITKIVQSVTCTNVSVNAQPTNIIACIGSDASISVTANGTNPTYQWQVSTNSGVSFSDIPGATAATLTIPNVTASLNNNRYKVLISNACPSNVTSSEAILTTNEPASIISQPSGVSVCEGGNASFSVVATGTGLTYQWQVSTDGGITFNNITAATSNSYSINNITAALNGNQYRAIITGCNPTALNSNSASLTVSNLATIATQPANTPACNGGSATFSVAASGSALTYQWQISTDGGISYSNISGANTNSLVLNGVDLTMNNNRYRVFISNNCSSSITSNAGILIVSNPAVLVSQPLNNTVCEGTNTTFAVTATGTNVTYQWQVSSDGGITFSNIPGATSTILNLTGVTSAMNNNRYRAVLFSCSATGLNSDPAILNVTSLATFNVQPANTSACVGSNATFNTNANGSNVTYQWQVSTDGGLTFTNIPGATNTSLTLSNVMASMNNYQYKVLISNTCTSELSSIASILTVNDQPTITSQPANTSLCPGSNATFSITASGPGLSTQWQLSTDGGLSFSNISGATNNNLTLNNVLSSMNGNQYKALILSSCSSSAISTDVATLTVLDAALISQQPADYNGCAGSNASFTANATGNNVSYQWQVSTNAGITFTDIAGETSSTLTLNNVTTAMNNNKYKVLINANPCGNVSSLATLHVLASPAVNISANPAKNLFPGLTTTLTASSTPSSNNYAWYKNGNLITGVTGNSILVTYEDRGIYTAKDLNGCDNISNTLIVSDSATSNLFIYPNPNNGQFSVQYFNSNTNEARFMVIFDAKGSKVYEQSFTVTGAYDKMEIILKKLAAGTYLLALYDSKGNKLASGKFIRK